MKLISSRDAGAPDAEGAGAEDAGAEAPIAGVLGLKDAPHACRVHALFRGQNHGVEQNQGGYRRNESRADATGSPWLQTG
jgi:hypothetical protein